MAVGVAVSRGHDVEGLLRAPALVAREAVAVGPEDAAALDLGLGPEGRQDVARVTRVVGSIRMSLSVGIGRGVVVMHTRGSPSRRPSTRFDQAASG